LKNPSNSAKVNMKVFRIRISFLERCVCRGLFVSKIPESSFFLREKRIFGFSDSGLEALF
jgi:hypothetical protein